MGGEGEAFLICWYLLTTFVININICTTNASKYFSCRFISTFCVALSRHMFEKRQITVGNELWELNRLLLMSNDHVKVTYRHANIALCISMASKHLVTLVREDEAAMPIKLFAWSAMVTVLRPWSSSLCTFSFSPCCCYILASLAEQLPQSCQFNSDLLAWNAKVFNIFKVNSNNKHRKTSRDIS